MPLMAPELFLKKSSIAFRPPAKIRSAACSLPTTTAAVDQLAYETSTMPTPEVGHAVTAGAGGSIPCVN